MCTLVAKQVRLVAVFAALLDGIAGQLLEPTSQHHPLHLRRSVYGPFRVVHAALAHTDADAGEIASHVAGVIIGVPMSANYTARHPAGSSTCDVDADNSTAEGIGTYWRNHRTHR